MYEKVNLIYVGLVGESQVSTFLQHFPYSSRSKLSTLQIKSASFRKLITKSKSYGSFGGVFLNEQILKRAIDLLLPPILRSSHLLTCASQVHCIIKKGRDRMGRRLFLKHA